MKSALNVVMIGVVALTLAACAAPKRGQDQAEDAEAQAGAQQDQQAQQDERYGLGDEAGISGESLDDPDSILSKRTVYFDFDSAEVNQQDRDVIIAHADYLASHPEAKIVLEGHADERGTREYNMALGERRAKAVRQLMLLQGASGDQIDYVSFGEERPVALGHDEEAWRLNRRVEILYTDQ